MKVEPNAKLRGLLCGLYFTHYRKIMYDKVNIIHGISSIDRARARKLEKGSLLKGVLNRQVKRRTETGGQRRTLEMEDA